MEGIGEGFEALWVLMIVCLCFVPLGMWKLIEIIVWLCHHIHFS